MPLSSPFSNKYILGRELIENDKGKFEYELHLNSRNCGYLWDGEKEHCEHILDGAKCLYYLKKRTMIKDKSTRINKDLCYICFDHKSNGLIGGKLNSVEQKKENNAILSLGVNLNEIDPRKKNFENFEEFQTTLKAFIDDREIFSFIKNEYKIKRYDRNTTNKHIAELGLAELNWYQKFTLIFETPKSPLRDQMLFANVGSGKTALINGVLGKFKIEAKKAGKEIKCVYVTAKTLTANVEGDKWGFQYVVDIYNKSEKDEDMKIKGSFKENVLVLNYKELISWLTKGKVPVPLDKKKIMESQIPNFLKTKKRLEKEEQGGPQKKVDNSRFKTETLTNRLFFRFRNDLPKKQDIDIELDYIAVPKFVYGSKEKIDLLKNVVLAIDEFQNFFKSQLLPRDIKKSAAIILRRAILYSKEISGEDAVIVILSSGTPVSDQLDETFQFIDFLNLYINKQSVYSEILKNYSIEESDKDKLKIIDKSKYPDILKFIKDDLASKLYGLVTFVDLQYDYDHFAKPKIIPVIVKATQDQSNHIRILMAGNENDSEDDDSDDDDDDKKEKGKPKIIDDDEDFGEPTDDKEYEEETKKKR